jgi:hypothetical protein
MLRETWSDYTAVAMQRALACHVHSGPACRRSSIKLSTRQVRHCDSLEWTRPCICPSVRQQFFCLNPVSPDGVCTASGYQLSRSASACMCDQTSSWVPSDSLQPAGIAVFRYAATRAWHPTRAGGVHGDPRPCSGYMQSGCSRAESLRPDMWKCRPC